MIQPENLFFYMLLKILRDADAERKQKPAEAHLIKLVMYWWIDGFQSKEVNWIFIPWESLTHNTYRIAIPPKPSYAVLDAAYTPVFSPDIQYEVIPINHYRNDSWGIMRIGIGYGMDTNTLVIVGAPINKIPKGVEYVRHRQ